MQNDNPIKSLQITITGLIQGVGFRPFIYRIAKENTIYGQIYNTNENVIINAEGKTENLKKFIDLIKKKAPPVAKIEKINIYETPLQSYTDFKIITSRDNSEQITQVSPDISVCPDCLADMKTQPHRIDYPFINCTNCGPRFSIIKALPYDRDKTTMQPFTMCNLCRNEYADILNRRFHAQPIACNNCGPTYNMIIQQKSITDIHTILNKATKLLEAGKIIAIQGVGGFHLMCSALNETAVSQIRKAKNRDGKPFAVMFKNISVLQEFATLSEHEIKELESWQRPIVLVKQKKELAPSVNRGFNNIGAMLPYMPFHYLLFDKLTIPAIVLTSGNLSDEPVIIKHHEAIEKLMPVTDALILYNREIQNRVDDSVIFITNNKTRFIRRSRGFVPTPLNSNYTTEGILATGAELVNCFAIGKSKQAILSQHIGDLKNIETYNFFTSSIENFKQLFRFKPDLIACDLHPDYLSTRYAIETGLPLERIQHHHAHIASCMAENGLDEKVIGISFDGTGLGDDNTIWGGEVFICDLKDYTRYSHINYIPLPGGDKAVEQPWRTALSYLYSIYGNDWEKINLPFLKSIPNEQLQLTITAIEKKINCPLTSSAGRLFDAVSVISEICHTPAFHAEAPMRLETTIKPNCTEIYPFSITPNLNFTETIQAIIHDIYHKTEPGIISARFHNTIINCIFAIANQIRQEQNIQKVVLSGGVFQNRYLIEKSEQLLQEKGFTVFSNNKVPANDGGIALGQLIIAAKRRSLCV